MTFSIGHLSKAADVGIDTIRFYEREGLLVPAERTDAGYRRFGPADLKRLRFIRRAKALGFSLEDIRDLLSLSAAHGVAGVRKRAQARMDEIAIRIAELRRVHAALAQLVERCPGKGRADQCPILSALGEEEAS